MTILRLKSSNERSYFMLFGTITISDKGNDSPIIFEFLPLYFIETFKDIKTKFSFRFVSYLDIFVSQIISVFRGRLPRNEIQNISMRRNFRNPSSSSNNLNKIHLKFIRSYLPDIKIVLYQPPRGGSLILLGTRTFFQPMRHPSCSKITIRDNIFQFE